jgi:hypothetical protein
MDQIVINAASILPLLWAFVLGIFLGWILSYHSARRKGYEQAVQERDRELSAQAFAQYIQSVAQGVSHGSAHPKE